MRETGYNTCDEMGSGSKLQGRRHSPDKEKASGRRKRRQSLKQHLIRGCGHHRYSNRRSRTHCLPGL